MKGLLFTYLLTYGGALASLVDPYVGLLIYICFAIIKPEAMWYWSVTPGNYSRIVAIALLIGWAVHGLGRWQFGAAKGVVLALLGYWGWSAVSAALAPDHSVAWNFVESLSKIVLPFVVGITVIDSLQKLKQLAWVILLSQGYVAFEMNLAYYQGFNRVKVIGIGGMDNNCVAIAMVTGTGVAIFMALSSEQWWKKGAAFLCAILMIHTVLLAFSRGGMLALCLTAPVAFLLIPKRPSHYALLIVALAIGIRLAGPQVVERFGTTFVDTDQIDASAESRLVLWANCWDVMLRYPLLGCGPDHWGFIAVQYGWGKGKEAHSLWFQTGAELGFIGLGFLLTFYGYCMFQLWTLRRRLESAHDWYAYGAGMVITSLVGFMVAAQFVSLEGLELPFYVTLLGAGVLKLATVAEDAPAPAVAWAGVPASVSRASIVNR